MWHVIKPVVHRGRWTASDAESVLRKMAQLASSETWEGGTPQLPADLHHRGAGDTGSAVICLHRLRWRSCLLTGNIHNGFLRMVDLFSCLLMEWLGFSVLASCFLLVASHLSLSDFVPKGGSGSCMAEELSVTLLSSLWKWRQAHWHCLQFTGEQHHIICHRDPPAHW